MPRLVAFAPYSRSGRDGACLREVWFLTRPLSCSRHRRQKEEDPTQLAATFGVTQLAGSVSLLYGTLLQMGAPSGSRAAGQEPPALPPGRLTVTAAALDLLNQMGQLDLPMFQVG